MIPWTWVSRARFDNEREARRVQMIELRTAEARVAALEAHVEMAKDNLSAWEKLYSDLLGKYQTLKVLGANGPESNPAPVKAERDIVSEAIIVRSGNNVHLRRHYAEYVTFQRAAGIADVEIAAGILEGEVEEDGTP